MLNKKFQEKNQNKDNNAPIKTSATIRKKNYIQLKIQAKKLNLPAYQLGILCLDYLIKNQHEKLTKRKKTIEYNSPDTYSTLGLIYENHDKFELFLSLKIINRISISYLMDYAIEIFLSIVINLILNKQNNYNFQNSEILDLLILSIKTNTPQFHKTVRKNHFFSIYYEFSIQ